MNEFDEWLDGLIKKHAPKGFPTERHELRAIAVELAQQVAQANTVFCSCHCHDIVNKINAIKSVYEELIERIRQCCGQNAGKVFCERHGCGALKTIAANLVGLAKADYSGKKSDAP